ncbi:MAG: flagellar biosynthesis protein FlgN [Treponemataceae bacterium]
MEDSDNELTREELDQRVAILKRLKNLLEMQRSKFQEYLFVLEKQENEISNENYESISAHTEIEQQIVNNIENLQKVIKPMEELYQQANSPFSADIPQLKIDLENLQKNVLIQNEKNRILLKQHLSQIKEKLGQLNNPKINPYVNHLSIYAQKRQTAGMIDVQG